MVTPKALRLHIALVGRVNVGKSSLLNLLVGQEAAIVSPVPGTTTDVIEKNQELHGIGPVVWSDLAGFDDVSELGQKRVEKAKVALSKADIVLVVCDGDQIPTELIADIKVPMIMVHNKADMHAVTGDGIWINALDISKRDEILEAIKSEIQKVLGDKKQEGILDGLVPANGTVVLIMPQDAEAPKGRLIMPQVQVIRAALDLGLIVMAVQPDQYEVALAKIGKPDLVIADSQVLKFMLEKTPSDISCTTFSVLFARQKGDFEALVQGAKAIKNLKIGDRVLIAEACTHHAMNDDIARVKIPALFKKAGFDVAFEWVSGNDFPADLSSYKLVVHCGGCMLNKTQMMNRIEKVKKVNVAVTNYGLCIAALQGNLERIVKVFE